MGRPHCRQDKDYPSQNCLGKPSTEPAQKEMSAGKGSGMRISTKLKQEAAETVNRQRVHIGLSARMRLALLDLYERIRSGDYDPARMIAVAREEKSSETQLRFRFGYGLYQRHVDRMIELVENDLQRLEPKGYEEIGEICGGDIQRAALVTIVRGRDVF